MSLYDTAADTALSLLQQFGEAATIRRTTVTSGSPSNPAAGSATMAEYACRLAIFPVDLRDIDSTTIKAGDYRVIVAAKGLAITPTTTDHIVCSAGTLAIVDAGRFAPTGMATHYRMVARR
ncbi:hypothetical protein P6F26_16810 [Roseibacterium sp. SDUM158017]|uniref:hypothetical protein n=1 Tax=Roseicyclus salinarum TaxID=3036773 RepID=UPI0024152A10|nr:hypothetical protein [Roseibacterium sp. SDUM158017]MDG4650111.1 hypothetical protein [Roseibacterium sp. SDUM158017]